MYVNFSRRPRFASGSMHVGFVDKVALGEVFMFFAFSLWVSLQRDSLYSYCQGDEHHAVGSHGSETSSHPIDMSYTNFYWKTLKWETLVWANIDVNMKADLKEMKRVGANCFNLLQNRVEWWAFLNTVMNLLVPQKGKGIWLTRSTNVRLKKRTLPRALTLCMSVLIRSRVSSGSIVSGYGLDGRAIGVRSPAGAKDFSSSLCVQTGSGAHPASLSNGYRGPFPGGKSAAGAWRWPLTPI
jgi:hypothetical protein